MQRLFHPAFPRALRGLTALLVLALWPAPVSADFYVYPTKEHSPEQQEKDQFECYAWAKGRTGFDPMKAPEASEPPPPNQTAGTSPVRGAARGAATGAVVGAIAGDAGKGAAAGAMIGGMRRRRAVRANAQAQETGLPGLRSLHRALRASLESAV
jgi:hypothetical protein